MYIHNLWKFVIDVLILIKYKCLGIYFMKSQKPKGSYIFRVTLISIFKISQRVWILKNVLYFFFQIDFVYIAIAIFTCLMFWSSLTEETNGYIFLMAYRSFYINCTLYIFERKNIILNAENRIEHKYVCFILIFFIIPSL